MIILPVYSLLHIPMTVTIRLWIKTRVVAGPPSVANLCRGRPLLQTLVADLCVEYGSLQGACRGGVCRRTPPSVTNLCREMAAQACYKANVFDSLPKNYSYKQKRSSTCFSLYLCIIIDIFVIVVIITRGISKSGPSTAAPLGTCSERLLRFRGHANEALELLDLLLAQEPRGG